ncbi:histidine phosphatase family protein [Litoribrevibacter euphylliae]|uniref:Histidine phosphatase family protein n=1 Tax=Litoribrevibacter euphylliae TaxID=1834034 RepID=A0ABV7HE46_9GAMM
MTQTTRVDLLRHGECEGAQSIYRGIIDSPLSKKGWETLDNAIASVETDWDVIITSPKQRCKRYAMALAEELKKPFEIDTGFREINFGRWEGLTFKDVWKAESDNVTAFYTQPDSNPHGGESVAQMTQRVNAAWSKMLARHQGKRILLVNHGGIIRVLLSELLSIPMSSVSKMEVPYGCLTRFLMFANDKDGEQEGNQEYHPMMAFHNKAG